VHVSLRAAIMLLVKMYRLNIIIQIHSAYITQLELCAVIVVLVVVVLATVCCSMEMSLLAQRLQMF